MENLIHKYDLKRGDLVLCEYAEGETAKAIVISFDDNSVEVEVGIAGRRSKQIEKEIIKISKEKIYEYTCI